MIKVLHIISDLNLAGAQTVVMNYIRFFSCDPDIKIIVVVINGPNGSEYEKECEYLGVELHFLNYTPYKGLALVNRIRLQKLIYKELKLIHPQIVHTHVTPILSYTVIPIILSRIKVRVHTLHSDPYAIKGNAYHWARIAFHKAHFHPICVTDIQAKKAENRYRISNYDIIKNGIDEQRFGHTNMVDVRYDLGINEDCFVIGCVGRFNKVKNHSFLLKLFAEFIKLKPNSKLLLVGDGEERGNIEKLADELRIRDYILFTGIRSDVEKMYYAMNLFMLTSFFESSSMVTVEAQCAGLRCVISDSIPENVVVTPLVNRLSLNAPISTWLSAMQGNLPTDKVRGTLYDFSIRQSCKELKSIYLQLLTE